MKRLAIRAQPRRAAANHPAAFNPNVIGGAGLQKGAAQHYRGLMLLGQDSQGASEPFVVRFEQRPGLLQQQDQRGVGDVLAGGAPMHESRGKLVGSAHSLGEQFYEWYGWCSRP